MLKHTYLLIAALPSSPALYWTFLKSPQRNYQRRLYNFLCLKLRPKFCLNEWQDIWDCCESNKLHSIYPPVGSVAHSKNMSRYDSVHINRLRIGHSRLTHTFCVVIIHLLVNCVDFLFPWDTSWSNVSVCGTFVEIILQSLLLRSCFKVSTILPWFGIRD